MKHSQDRTNQKLVYTKIHLEELEKYHNALSNDAWENAHQESCFYHLAGAVEGLLHEINDGYSLTLTLRQVKWEKVKEKLDNTNQTSPAFDYLCSLKGDSRSWLSQLFEWRNHGTHRRGVGKLIKLSTSDKKLDNEFKDPRNDQPQIIYPNMGCLEVLKRLKDDVEDLINHCRKIDPNL